MKTRLKIWIDCLECLAKTLFKDRLDFPFEKGIETMDTLPKIQGQKIIETTLIFSN